MQKYKTIELAFKKPFSFEKTFYIPSHFPSKLELYENGNYYMSLNFNGQIVGLKFYQKEENNLFVDIFSDTKLSDEYINSLITEIDFRFSLTKDYSEFYDKFKSDKFLSSIIERNCGKHISSIYSLYQNLIISTFLQNATIQRTISMCENMMSRYGSTVNFDGVQMYAFWDIKDFNPEEEDLKKMKVGYRDKNIIRINNYFKENGISDIPLRDLPTPQLVKELLKIFGVGKQTVYYLVSGQFHRTEYLEHIPLWERKILSKYIFDIELQEEKVLVNWFKEKYGNWCGFALSMIFEDIFYQHKQSPLLWLNEILKAGNVKD
ncbi:hypothetical protein FACS189411_10820 [Bacteroidia bacterium]|nr:hypothetical protein FACS189411_10820 [Bacteroidia bacterium]